MAAKASGLALKSSDIPTVLGMAARGDRNHDIAAWFGVNQGRIKEAKDGKYGTPIASSAQALPPKGPPGIKGRRLREAMNSVAALLAQNDEVGAKAALDKALKNYDANEA